MILSANFTSENKLYFVKLQVVAKKELNNFDD